MKPRRTFPIDPITGLDAEDLFGQVIWHRHRGLTHPNDGTPIVEAMQQNRQHKQGSAS